jgi:fructose-bisphosphate aldolase class II
LGFGSVMFDASTMAYEDNITATAAVVRQCHDGGLDVEAELGEIGGKDGVHAAGVRTKPDEARTFVEATGVDALGVAVGTSHAMTERSVALDLELISALRNVVPVPLVLHGSFRRSRRGAGSSSSGRHDQDQYRNPSQSRVHRIDPSDAGCRSGNGR